MEKVSIEFHIYQIRIIDEALEIADAWRKDTDRFNGVRKVLKPYLNS